MVDYVQGLRFLHSHNLIHLDVKPDNLFKDSNGAFKIGDFGLAVMRSAEVGSAYQSPAAVTSHLKAVSRLRQSRHSAQAFRCAHVMLIIIPHLLL